MFPVWIKSDIENSIFIASGHVKIRDFASTNQFAELNEFMKWWRMQLGITVIANHSEPQMNILHIQESYSDLSIEDLKLAVKYSFTGVLGVDFIAYNSFSPLYISKILNAYKIYRDDQLNHIAREKLRFDEKEKAIKKAESEKKTPEESRRIYVKGYIERLLEEELYITDVKDMAFEVFMRYMIDKRASIQLGNYFDEAIKLIQKKDVTFEPFGEAYNGQAPGLEVDRYCKFLAMLEFFRIKDTSKLSEWINDLTPQQLLGE